MRAKLTQSQKIDFVPIASDINMLNAAPIRQWEHKLDTFEETKGASILQTASNLVHRYQQRIAIGPLKYQHKGQMKKKQLINVQQNSGNNSMIQQKKRQSGNTNGQLVTGGDSDAMIVKNLDNSMLNIRSTADPLKKLFESTPVSGTRDFHTESKMSLNHGNVIHPTFSNPYAIQMGGGLAQEQSPIRVFYTQQKNRGYSKQLETYAGHLDGLKTLLTQPSEKSTALKASAQLMQIYKQHLQSGTPHSVSKNHIQPILQSQASVPLVEVFETQGSSVDCSSQEAQNDVKPLFKQDQTIDQQSPELRQQQIPQRPQTTNHAGVSHLGLNRLSKILNIGNLFDQQSGRSRLLRDRSPIVFPSQFQSQSQTRAGHNMSQQSLHLRFPRMSQNNNNQSLIESPNPFLRPQSRGQIQESGAAHLESPSSMRLFSEVGRASRTNLLDQQKNTLTNSQSFLRSSQGSQKMRQVLSMSKVELIGNQGKMNVAADSQRSHSNNNHQWGQLNQSISQLQQAYSPLKKATVLSKSGRVPATPNIKSRALKIPEQQQPSLRSNVSQSQVIPRQIGPVDEHGRVIFIPKTGIDQIFMLHQVKFVRPKHPHIEPLYSFPDPSEKAKQIEIYKNHTYDFQARLVYDSMDTNSPLYQGALVEEEYIDLKDLISTPIIKPDGLLVPQFGGAIAVRPPVTVNFFYQKLRPYYRLGRGGESDETLVFESRFECGNLRKSVQVDRYEYELQLKTDTNSSSNYTQWFYFRVSNTRKDKQYTFHITNFVKPDSLFNNGMKPLIYSRKESDISNQGWTRAGEDIAYYPTPIKSYKPSHPCYMPPPQPWNPSPQNSLYTLSFNFTFTHDHDEVYFAYCYPYSYSEVQKYMLSISGYNNQDILRRAPLCQTLAGNQCDMLIITNFLSKSDQIADRPAVILTARVHPGESNSSYIMEGLIEYLISTDPGAKLLRDRFVFKIVPMLNPDGVVVGNYRCSLSGADLNRQWISPSGKFYPEIHAVKQMMRKTLESRDIAFYCDFHGHSRAKNAFMYGCQNVNNKDKKLKERIFPLLFGKRCEEFSFEGSAFNVHKVKESTARVVLWKEYSLINSFTLECSFLGPTKGTHKDAHFSIQNLLNLGKQFCLTLIEYSELEKAQDSAKQVKRLLKEIELIIKAQKEAQQPDPQKEEDIQIDNMAQYFPDQQDNEPPLPFKELNYDELGAKLDQTIKSSPQTQGRKKNTMGSLNFMSNRLNTQKLKPSLPKGGNGVLKRFRKNAGSSGAPAVPRKQFASSLTQTLGLKGFLSSTSTAEQRGKQQ
ncbi:hypothetical protein FGO68_gene10605 [Halteria grandinella]|uniref:Peptidase M14 domain-containing protein n=1 Tax=Halteria grandinella TaxID=5974 RepID=A0A8J8T8J4_HALGN|nr:hypothetical protein FGO68_gene10605 [Halteria grandinella]